MITIALALPILLPLLPSLFSKLEFFSYPQRERCARARRRAAAGARAPVRDRARSSPIVSSGSAAAGTCAPRVARSRVRESARATSDRVRVVLVCSTGECSRERVCVCTARLRARCKGARGECSSERAKKVYQSMCDHEALGQFMTRRLLGSESSSAETVVTSSRHAAGYREREEAGGRVTRAQPRSSHTRSCAMREARQGMSRYLGCGDGGHQLTSGPTTSEDSILGVRRSPPS